MIGMVALTLCELLASQSDHEFQTADGRPVPVNQNGKLLKELF